MRGGQCPAWLAFGCNTFLYQADHLSLPGGAVSPSLMIAAMLERLSGLAMRLDKDDDAIEWAEKSARIYRECAERLWNEYAGCFDSDTDTQASAILRITIPTWSSRRCIPHFPCLTACAAWSI